ncbi:GNAT family N-acetyltransferase [Celeribacter neptunius]|uniref:Protein N-acetyltransferase, RimJ/RimL family n=1 Tax=Celeribacter neptunius TaxID=588602 RepID=A0A1I3QU16_9RHOB|nr:GNAT family N-acetyltransferase [Celeribacter neptunius]SFJ37763.1 Protein N-acetyltransferase, RimJ/RimL family [Celeribacter neptunius]
MSLQLTVPALETERLRLRGPENDDFEAFAQFYTNEDRSWGVGGPMDRATAWRFYGTNLGHWLLRGYGFWTVIEKASGAQVGRVGLWNPEGWLEAEIGWMMYDGFEGKGYAFEAAKAVRDHAYDTLGWGPLTSVIAPGNDRSVALAERMGARFERNWVSPSGKDALIYRHPASEELQ